jgi:ABC-type Mn2+/Zn2+ transport system ATPase subunit
MILSQAQEHVCWGSGAKHSSKHLLKVEKLEVHYQSVVALKNINFEIRCGQSLALVGPNGAGKSTLIKALAGLTPVYTGEIYWRDQLLIHGGYDIAYLPQRGDIDWNFPITVEGLVEMGRYPNLGLFKRYSEHDVEIVERALEVMDLQDLRKRQIRELSGGQQQRVFIARALAQEAHVLLLDEPFTGLDRPSQELLAGLMKQLTQEGRLLIASHHDLNTVGAIFDQILLLNQELVAFGECNSLIKNELLLKNVFGDNP